MQPLLSLCRESQELQNIFMMYFTKINTKILGRQMGAILSNWVKSKAFSVSIRAMSFWVRFWYTYNGWIVIFFAMYTCFSFLSSNSLYKFSMYEIKWLIDFNFSLWLTQNSRQRLPTIYVANSKTKHYVFGQILWKLIWTSKVSLS